MEVNARNKINTIAFKVNSNLFVEIIKFTKEINANYFYAI